MTTFPMNRTRNAFTSASSGRAAHKRSELGEAIARAGCMLMYLPPYSPDLNPIELAMAKLKSLIRTAGKRTVDGLWEFLGQAPDAFAPDECRRSMRHWGYT